MTTGHGYRDRHDNGQRHCKRRHDPDMAEEEEFDGLTEHSYPPFPARKLGQISTCQHDAMEDLIFPLDQMVGVGPVEWLGCLNVCPQAEHLI